MEIKLLLNLLFREYGLLPSLLIHAGASRCQERDLYDSYSFQKVIWIEAIPDIVRKNQDQLANYQNQEIIEAVLWESPGHSMQFHVSSNDGESSSLLSLAKHRLTHPTIVETETIEVTTTTLDLLLESVIGGLQYEVALLVVDLQGADLQALRGSVETLKNTCAVFVEVSLTDFYRNQPLFKDVHEFLNRHGFALIEHDLGDSKLMGDALYIKQSWAHQRGIAELEPPAGDVRIKTNFARRIRYFLIRLGIPANWITRNY